MDWLMQDMLLATTVGAVATILAAVSLLPQVMRTWRTRSAIDLSFGWMLTALMSMVLWIVYGLLVSAWVVAISNAITLLLIVVLLGMKVRFDRRGMDRSTRLALDR